MFAIEAGIDGGVVLADRAQQVGRGYAEFARELDQGLRLDEGRVPAELRPIDLLCIERHRRRVLQDALIEDNMHRHARLTQQRALAVVDARVIFLHEALAAVVDEDLPHLARTRRECEERTRSPILGIIKHAGEGTEEFAAAIGLRTECAGAHQPVASRVGVDVRAERILGRQLLPQRLVGRIATRCQHHVAPVEVELAVRRAGAHPGYCTAFVGEQRAHAML